MTSLLSPLHCLLVLALVFQTIHAKVVTYNWDLTWVYANPDGEINRPVIGINKQWPCPAINARKGDRIVINLSNSLGNQSTSLHFHGLHQQGSNDMDGPPGVTQCAIPPGSSFTYDFTVNQVGSYWYHSHTLGQLSDGLRGPLIISDPQSPYAGQYSDELVVAVSDWYHDEAANLIPYYLSPDQDPDGAEPVPYSSLINEAQNTQLKVKPGTTYLVRIINMAAFSQSFIHFDQHEMTIIAIDGVYVEPVTITSVYIAVAQRYDVLLTTKRDKSRNYAFASNLDESMFDNIPSYLQPNATGYLVYNPSVPLPLAAPLVKQYNLIDDFNLVPLDHQPALNQKPDVSISLDLNFFLENGENRGGFNNISYYQPQIPTLYTALSAKPPSNSSIYSTSINPYILPDNALVEITINNYDEGNHPVHLHGHQPQIISRQANVIPVSPDKRRRRFKRTASTSGAVFQRDYNANSARKAPMRRDTWMVPALGRTVIRFQATNPGVWLLHCHMEWHVAAGLTTTLIEAPKMLKQDRGDLRNPKMVQLCKAQGIQV